MFIDNVMNPIAGAPARNVMQFDSSVDLVLESRASRPH